MSINLASIIKTTLQTSLTVLFPAFCVSCGKEGRYLCEKCHVFAGEASLICPVCQESSFTGETHAKCKNRYGLNGLANCWEYEGAVKKILGRIKYRGITNAIQELAAISFQMMAADQARFDTFFKFLLDEPRITYVPMFSAKEKKRGFNQAKLIAKKLAKINGQAVLSLLTKTKNTKSQTELTKKERLENVKNTFAIAKGRLKSDFNQIKRVVLVDDIYTTGATMQECCKVLKKAGAKEVWGFTLARTP